MSPRMITLISAIVITIGSICSIFYFVNRRIKYVKTNGTIINSINRIPLIKIERHYVNGSYNGTICQYNGRIFVEVQFKDLEGKMRRVTETVEKWECPTYREGSGSSHPDFYFYSKYEISKDIKVFYNKSDITDVKLFVSSKNPLLGNICFAILSLFFCLCSWLIYSAL